MTDLIDPVELAQRFIRCRSITPVDDGALDIVAEELAALRFKIERLRFDGDGSYPVDNIFARIGTQSPHICFAGHVDVVPPGHEADWKYPPFAAEIHDGVLYGRGAADMKSGVAASIAAAAAFLQDNKNFNGSISFLITADEEADSINGTAKVVKWLQENGHVPDVALVAEPSNASEMGQTMRVGRRGSYHAALYTAGIQGHSAYPDRFVNPIDKMVRLLHAVIDLKLDDGTESMPPSHIAITTLDVGNPARNIVPARAEAHINIRFNELWTSAGITKKLHATLDVAGAAYRLEPTPCNAESFITSSFDWADMVAVAVEKISGSRPAYDAGGGTSDARFIAKICPVIEYGVITETNHQVDERMRTSDIETLASTYVQVLKDVFASNSISALSPSTS